MIHHLAHYEAEDASPVGARPGLGPPAFWRFDFYIRRSPDSWLWGHPVQRQPLKVQL